MEFIKTISDAFQSLAKNFNDRIKSPIGGAFFFSWLIFNWKLVYYISMQNEIPSKKIAYVETYLLDISQLLVFPALASIAYVLIYPIIYNASNLAWTYIDKNLKTLVAVQIEKKVLLTTEDRQQLYDVMRDQRVRHEDETEKLRGQVEALSKLAPEIETEIESEDRVVKFDGKVVKLDATGRILTTSDSDRTPEDLQEGHDYPITSNSPDEYKSFFHELFEDLTKKFLPTTEGSYRFKKLVANWISKDLDDTYHVKDIAKFDVLIRSMIKGLPNLYTPRALNVDGTSYQFSYVLSMLRTLELIDVVTKIQGGGEQSTYRLTTEAESEIITALKDIKAA